MLAAAAAAAEAAGERNSGSHRRPTLLWWCPRGPTAEERCVRACLCRVSCWSGGRRGATVTPRCVGARHLRSSPLLCSALLCSAASASPVACGVAQQHAALIGRLVRRRCDDASKGAAAQRIQALAEAPTVSVTSGAPPHARMPIASCFSCSSDAPAERLTPTLGSDLLGSALVLQPRQDGHSLTLRLPPLLGVLPPLPLPMHARSQTDQTHMTHSQQQWAAGATPPLSARGPGGSSSRAHSDSLVTRAPLVQRLAQRSDGRCFYHMEKEFS